LPTLTKAALIASNFIFLDIFWKISRTFYRHVWTQGLLELTNFDYLNPRNPTLCVFHVFIFYFLSNVRDTFEKEISD